MRSLGLVLVLTLAGCATYEGHPLPDKAAGNLVDRESWEGLTVGAALPRSSDEIVTLYGRDVMEENILPVAIYVENRSDTNEFTILVDDIVYKLPGGDTLRRQDPRKVQERVKFSMSRSFFAWIPLVIPGPFSMLDIAGANKDMLDDYIAKSFENINLPAQDPTTHRRVLFFRPPSDMDLDDSDYANGTLQVKVTRFSGSASNENPEKTLQIYFRNR